MNGPTGKAYNAFTAAYDHFNAELFDGRLPRCLITMQRKAKTYGYFAGARFGTRDGDEIADEIALNPSHFQARSIEASLSTLVHEMVHLEQHHHGKPSRTGYHNKQWADLMRAVGLIPSDTAAPGGKETGQSVSHYIEPAGRFELSCAALIATGFTLDYIELWDEADNAKAKKKSASKTKYTCPECDANAWAKPDARLLCGDCSDADGTLIAMTAEPTD